MPYYNKESQQQCVNSHRWLISKVCLIQGFFMWTSGGPFLWVCEELTSLGPRLQSACNITFQNWKHVYSGICNSCLCIWGRSFILILTLFVYWVCVLFGLHVIVNILGYFLNDKWPHASLCILIAALLVYHERISTYFSVILWQWC